MRDRRWSLPTILAGILPVIAWPALAGDVRRIPVYVTIATPEREPPAFGFPPASSLLDFDPRQPITIAVTAEAFHTASGLRVVGARRIEDSAEDLLQSLDKHPAFERRDRPDEALLNLTVTKSTRTAYWDEEFFDPATYRLEFRLKVGESPELSGVEEIDFRRELRPWRSVAERLVQRLASWLTGGEDADAAIGFVSPALLDSMVDLEDSFARSGRFTVVSREEEARLILRLRSREVRPTTYSWLDGPRALRRLAYRLEVAGTSFAVEDVESITEGAKPWRELAQKVVEKIEYWLLDNPTLDEASHDELP